MKDMMQLLGVRLSQWLSNMSFLYQPTAFYFCPLLHEKMELPTLFPGSFHENPSEAFTSPRLCSFSVSALWKNTHLSPLLYPHLSLSLLSPSSRWSFPRLVSTAAALCLPPLSLPTDYRLIEFLSHVNPTEQVLNEGGDTAQKT